MIESFLCGSKDELRRREGFHQRTTDCVNKYIARQTPEEYRDANQEKISKRAKQYYEENQEKITERVKQYYEANQENISKRDKQYYEANQEKISKRKKQYYEANQDRISEYYRMRYAHNNIINRLTLFIQSHIRKVNSI